MILARAAGATVACKQFNCSLARSGACRRPARRRLATYTEIPPPPDLADRVECFWTIRSAGPLAAERPNRVVPDNCTDIIFDFGDPPPGDGGDRRRLRSYAVGAMRRPLLVRLAGTVDLLGVRFRPGRGPAFFGVPADELTDATVPLDDLWGQAGRDAESVVAAADGVGRVRAFASLLRARHPGELERHPAVGGALRRIETRAGRVRVRELHEAVGLSRRHLERLFAEHVGVTPKTASRVARFHAARDELLDRPDLSAARIAFACGYADQPHLTREFKALAGIPPVAYRRERAKRGERADVASVQDDGRAPR